MEEREDREGGQSNRDRLGAPPQKSKEKILDILIGESLSDESPIQLRCPKRLEADNAIAK